MNCGRAHWRHLANTIERLCAAATAAMSVSAMQGMRYLQLSPVRVHGKLKSSNCVIDSRWVLKVTDFGVHGVYERYQTRLIVDSKGSFTRPPHLPSSRAFYVFCCCCCCWRYRGDCLSCLSVWRIFHSTRQVVAPDSTVIQPVIQHLDGLYSVPVHATVKPTHHDAVLDAASACSVPILHVVGIKQCCA